LPQSRANAIRQSKGERALDKGYFGVEQRIDRLARRVLDRLPRSRLWDGLVEFVVFGLKQGWACLFGGLMLALLLGTALFWPDGAALARYDFLVIAALAIQIGMIALRLETLAEARVIVIFHVVGTVMELFKTGAGSWTYPEPSLLRIGDVPLFSGFMYACVGSYMARIQRIFDIRFERYPPVWITALLALAIYVNFFSHHFVPDMRIPLFVVLALVYARTMMHYRVHRFWHRMPILLAFGLVTFFIWVAENLGTWSRAWLYPSQLEGWRMVGIEKFGSWYLLMTISVVLVTLVHRPVTMDRSLIGTQAPAP